MLLSLVRAFEGLHVTKNPRRSALLMWRKNGEIQTAIPSISHQKLYCVVGMGVHRDVKVTGRNKDCAYADLSINADVHLIIHLIMSLLHQKLAQMSFLMYILRIKFGYVHFNGRILLERFQWN